MKMLDNLKISQKISGVLAMLGLVTFALAFLGSVQIGNVDTQYSALVTNKLAGTMYRSRANTRMNAMMYDGYRLLADGRTPASAELMRKLAEDSDKAEGDIRAAIERDPAQTAALTATLNGVRRIREMLQRAAEYSVQGNLPAANSLLDRADREMADVFRASLTLVDTSSDEAEAQALELTSVSNRTKTIMLVIAFVSVLVGMAIGLLVARKGITGPLDRLKLQMGEIAAGDYRKEVDGIARGDEVGAMAKAVQVFRENGIAKAAADETKAKTEADQRLVVNSLSAHLSSLSDGDLTSTITADFPPEFAELKANFNGATSNLRDLIGSVRASATTIRSGSTEIAQASEDLARRTEANAASLEETSASVTQMDGRLKATAEAASRTVARADGAISTVRSGREVAHEAVEAMARVADGAKNIDSVIEGLDKIAFQTRVLAMNAAVEAGRAGEAGRGFAVVADLVSALAMRSEEEAARAREQLTATQADVIAAGDMVEKVDLALANITEDVNEVHQLLGQMAADNQAQSIAITEISSAVAAMDRSTQQNAAMVEETSASARNLSVEVNALNDQALKFNVGGHAGDFAGERTSAPRGRVLLGGKSSVGHGSHDRLNPTRTTETAPGVRSPVAKCSADRPPSPPFPGQAQMR